MSVKKKFLAGLGVLSMGFISGFGLIAYAHTIPGIDEPYNPEAYYSLTEISWADSPSPYALKDLASNGGSVFDYTRYIKSVLFGDKFEKLAETDADKTKNDEINSTPFSEEIFAETSAALKVIGIGTEKVARTATIDETNTYLRQGNDDHWDSYDQSSYNRQGKYQWLDDTYKNFADGAKAEIIETEKTMEAAKKIFEHTNAAQGHLQMYQAQNELKTLLAYELAQQNALDADFAQLQAVNQSAEYDSNVESAYIDSITKFDVIDPYDVVNFQLLNEEFAYEKPKPSGMPDFK
ncbi:MAG: hypothetical protein IJQ82_11590 [Selenomonadaceae bacterium]|nr:hypothetical protein [Selenomonadaceae bacterium]